MAQMVSEDRPVAAISPYEPLTFNSLFPSTVVESENPVPQSPRADAVSGVPPSPPERDNMARVWVKIGGLAFAPPPSSKELSSTSRVIGRVAGDDRNTHFQSSAMALVGMT